MRIFNFNFGLNAIFLVIFLFNISCNVKRDQSNGKQSDYPPHQEVRNDEFQENNDTLSDNQRKLDIHSSQTALRKPNQESPVTKHAKAVELNNEAMNKITYSLPPGTRKDTLLLLQAMTLLDKAILYDSAYYLAYANKAIILMHLNNDEAAIQELCAIAKYKPDYAEGYLFQGFIYEKNGIMDSAYIKYRSALSSYNSRIAKTNSISDKIDRAFTLSLINSEMGLSEIERLIDENPGNKTILFWKQQLFDNFDREKFIENQCTTLR